MLAAHADVTDSKAMQQLVNQAMSRFGHIDVVIANAGLYSFGLTWELTEQQWDETVAVVLKRGMDNVQNGDSSYAATTKWENNLYGFYQ